MWFCKCMVPSLSVCVSVSDCEHSFFTFYINHVTYKFLGTFKAQPFTLFSLLLLLLCWFDMFHFSFVFFHVFAPFLLFEHKFGCYWCCLAVGLSVKRVLFQIWTRALKSRYDIQRTHYWNFSRTTNAQITKHMLCLFISSRLRFRCCCRFVVLVHSVRLPHIYENSILFSE